MNRCKKHSVLIIALVLALASLVMACAKRAEETPYAPDFTLQGIDGESITLSDFRGTPVMLTFWTTQCPACEVQAPHIQSAYDDWAGEELTLLTIDVGESAAVVRDFVTSQGLTYPVLLDSQGRVAQAYGIPGVPVTFFVDAKGIAKAYKIGPFQSQKEIESLLESLQLPVDTDPE